MSKRKKHPKTAPAGKPAREKPEEAAAGTFGFQETSDDGSDNSQTSPTGGHTEENLRSVMTVARNFSPSPAEDYHDPFQTTQQRARDEKITDLLEAYVESYRKKSTDREGYRSTIFSVCITIVILFALVFGWLLCAIFAEQSLSEIRLEGAAAFATACLTFLGLIVKLMEIITQFCFPANDEEYITRIVESIQNNDLKNKKTSMGGKRNKKDETSG